MLSPVVLPSQLEPVEAGESSVTYQRLEEEAELQLAVADLQGRRRDGFGGCGRPCSRRTSASLLCLKL